MAFDIIAKSDIKTGKSMEWKLPPVKEEMAIVTPADLKFYDTYAPQGHRHAVSRGRRAAPHRHRPRRRRALGRELLGRQSHPRRHQDAAT